MTYVWKGLSTRFRSVYRIHRILKFAGDCFNSVCCGDESNRMAVLHNDS